MMNNRDVLDLARELGNSILESRELKKLLKAEEDFHSDQKVLDIIDSIKTLKADSSTESQDIENLEEQLEKSETIVNLNIAKNDYDKLFKNINNLISYITDDESRISLDSLKGKKACGGCSGSGCSKK